MEWLKLVPYLVTTVGLIYTINRNINQDKLAANLSTFDHDIVDRISFRLRQITELHVLIVKSLQDSDLDSNKKTNIILSIFNGELNLHLQELNATLRFLQQHLNEYTENDTVIDLVSNNVFCDISEIIYDDAQAKIFEAILEISDSLKDGVPFNWHDLNEAFFELESKVNRIISVVRVSVSHPKRRPVLEAIKRYKS